MTARGPCPGVEAPCPVWLCTRYETFVSGSCTSLPNRFSAIARKRYSYWKNRRSPLRRSAACDPPVTSNGANCTTDGSSFDWSTTTFSDTCAREASKWRLRPSATARGRQRLLNLPKPPFRDEFAQGDRGFAFVDADAEHVEVVVLGQPGHIVLPRPRAAREGTHRAARHHPGAAGLDVERLDPAGRDRRQLEGERAVDEHDEDVVGRVEVSELAQYLARVVEQEVGDDRYHRRLPHEAGERHAEALRSLHRLQAGLKLICVESVDHLVLADVRAHRGQLIE